MSYSAVTIGGSSGGNSGDGKSIRDTILQPGHSFVPFQAVRYDGTEWILASANSLAGSQVIGVVESVTPNEFVVVFQGEIRDIDGVSLVPGTMYYLGGDNDGEISISPPKNSNQFVRPLLTAIDTDKAIIINGRSIPVPESTPIFTSEHLQPIGTILPFSGTSDTPPADWLWADGSAVSRTTYADLYAVIGNTYHAEATLTTRTSDSVGVLTLTGGVRDLVVGDRLDLSWDGSSRTNVYIDAVTDTTLTISLGSGTNLPDENTTINVIPSASNSSKFFLPDIRGRTPIGHGIGDGLTEHDLGELGGEELHTLLLDEIPVHQHDGEFIYLQANSISATPTTYRVVVPVGFDIGQPDVLGRDFLFTAGGSLSHNIMQPWIGVRWMIRCFDTVITGPAAPDVEIPDPINIFTKTFTVVNPEANDKILLDRLPYGATIRRITGLVEGSASPGVDITIKQGTNFSTSGTNIKLNFAVTSSSTGSTTTTFDNEIVPVDRFVWCLVNSVSGTVDLLGLVIEYEVEV